MLSSFAGKVAELEKQSNENANLLGKLENLFGLSGETIPLIDIGSLQNNGDYPSSVAAILLQQRAKIKETDFKLNRVFDTLRRHDRAIAELRYHVNEPHPNEIDDFDENGVPVHKDNDGFTYNPMASEFTPRHSGAGHGTENQTQPVEKQDSSVLYSQTETERVQVNNVAGNDDEERAYTPQRDPDPLNPEQSMIACLGATANVHSEADKYLLKFTDINEELQYFKSRVVKLEAELIKKDQLLQSMANDSSDRNCSHKSEWIEHKMRLLKQDKRRRGETIGKLLKCIDDMKDQGRVDESRVSEGKYVLQATLKTRGWPQEERVKATVRALEAERVSMKIQYEAEKAAGLHDPVEPTEQTAT